MGDSFEEIAEKYPIVEPNDLRGFITDISGSVVSILLVSTAAYNELSPLYRHQNLNSIVHEGNLEDIPPSDFEEEAALGLPYDTDVGDDDLAGEIPDDPRLAYQLNIMKLTRIGAAVQTDAMFRALDGIGRGVVDRLFLGEAVQTSSHLGIRMLMTR